MAINGLGRLFDVGVSVTNANLSNTTGNRVSLRRAGGATVVASLLAAGTGTETTTLTLQQHTAATGGTSANLPVITQFFVKGATTLNGAETWARVTQAAAATISVTDTVGGLTAAAQKQLVVAFEVNEQSLDAGYAFISVNVGTLTNARGGQVIILPIDLQAQRRPDALLALNV